MIQTGILVLDWPLVAGCDAGGVVVKAGKNAISALGNPFKEGDQVFGCTRLGCAGYATFEEYVSYHMKDMSHLLNHVQFLMDSKLTYAVPKSLELVQASTLGVGLCVRLLLPFKNITNSFLQDCCPWYIPRAQY
jgi:NADPH:quinone reductase-like Zn-dependent oxidoreductase